MPRPRPPVAPRLAAPRGHVTRAMLLRSSFRSSVPRASLEHALRCESLSWARRPPPASPTNPVAALTYLLLCFSSSPPDSSLRQMTSTFSLKQRQQARPRRCDSAFPFPFRKIVSSLLTVLLVMGWLLSVIGKGLRLELSPSSKLEGRIFNGQPHLWTLEDDHGRVRVAAPHLQQLREQRELQVIQFRSFPLQRRSLLPAPQHQTD